GVLLTNGKVLLTASPSPPCKYPGPTTFFLYDPSTNKAVIESDSGNSGNASWKPTLTNIPSTLVTGHTYVISGTQFNGLSQACSYGDDAQMATNYPIVRLEDTSNNIFYLRTANHSTMGVATGA